MATARPPLNESTLRFQHARVTQEEASLQRNLESCRQQLADLKARAHEAGLGKLFRELEHPTPIPPRIEEATARVKVRESFSGQWNGMPYDAPAGAIIDVPRSYAKHAVAMFEIVDTSTPLFIPVPRP